MNDDDQLIPRVKISLGDPNFDRIIEVQTAMLAAAAADQSRDDIDPALHTALTMAAAGLLAGYLAGGTIVAGLASDRDKRRMGEMLLTNFRQGIQIGKQSTMRGVSEAMGTDTRQ